MSEPTSNDDLLRAIGDLKGRLDLVARPYEDTLSDRLFIAARERLFNYIKLGLFILVPVLTYVGYRSYTDIVHAAENAAEKQAADIAEREAKPKILKLKDDIDGMLKDAKDKLVWLDELTDPQTSPSFDRVTEADILRSKIDAVVAQSEVQLKGLVEQANDRLVTLAGAEPGKPVNVQRIDLLQHASLDPTQIPPLPSQATEGYAYYGLQLGETPNSGERAQPKF
ncbi:MAG TPA: hypothetical protein VIT91_18610 [Chthoniobacterales bacterium]